VDVINRFQRGGEIALLCGRDGEIFAALEF